MKRVGMGRKRSTRYQNFRQSGWYTPELGEEHRAAYTQAISSLFDGYDALSAGMLEALKGVVARPETMKPDAYERTLKARAFDVARYLLPMATNTSLGQIVNARTLETQVSRLLTSRFAEVRGLGEALRKAAAEPAWNVQRDKLEELAGEGLMTQEAAEEVLTRLMPPVRVAPTLVKYATPNEYYGAAKRELAQAAKELMKGAPVYPAPLVDLLDDDEDLEVEIATSLLYPQCHYSYRQLRGAVMALSETQRTELVKLGAAHRGKHDELIRAFQAGHGFPVRHPDGYWRLPRYAPAPAVRATGAGVQRRAWLRGAGVPGAAYAGRGRGRRSVSRCHGCGLGGASGGYVRVRSRRLGKVRSICCRWELAAGRCSRWTLRKRCISRS